MSRTKASGSAVKPSTLSFDRPYESPLRLGSLDTIILYIWLAERAAARRFHREMGTRSGRFTALSLIEENPGTNQKALGAAVGRDKSTLSLALRDLEQDGFIERTRSAADARASELWLTDAGTRKLASLKEGMKRLNDQMEQVVGDRREDLIKVLKDIAVAFDDDQEDSI